MLQITVVPKTTKPLENQRFEVPGAGLEPALPQWEQDFKSCVSTNSTTRACSLSEANVQKTVTRVNTQQALSENNSTDLVAHRGIVQRFP